MPETVRKRASSPYALPRWQPRYYEGNMSRERDESSTGEAGLSQLLLTMRPELLRFMLVRQCAPAEVEDLFQDLYVKLTRTRSGPVSNPRAYLYQMANNLLHDHRRGHERQRARDDHWVRNQIGPDLERDAGPSPEESAIARDELARVNRVIATMPDRTALILKLYRLDGQSQKAIADSLGLSLSAVEKHLQRAYRKLLILREELDNTAHVPQEEADDVSTS
jgi:RNA polymerase sigma-70 factor (ECF subfamily)